MRKNLGAALLAAMFLLSIPTGSALAEGPERPEISPWSWVAQAWEWVAVGVETRQHRCRDRQVAD